MDDLISRQAAIDALEGVVYGDSNDKRRVMFIVEQLPPAQPEPCEIEQYVETCEECGFCDTISRQKAIDAQGGKK